VWCLPARQKEEWATSLGSGTAALASQQDTSKAMSPHPFEAFLLKLDEFDSSLSILKNQQNPHNS
jgi:hypothetical protein